MSSPTNSTDAVLLRSTLLYGTSTVLQRAIPFLLLPITTRYLTPEDFGIVATFMAIVALTTPFAGLNTPYAIGRSAFDRERVDFPAYVANCLGILVAGMLLTSLILWSLGGAITEMTGLPGGWSLVAVLAAAGQVFILILLTIWQMHHQTTRYALLQVSRSACSAGLTLFLVIGLGLRWEGVLIALLATTGIFALVCSRALRPWVTPRYDRMYASHALRFGGALIPHTLAAVAITSADRFFVSHYAGVSETGLYSVGYQVGSIVLFAGDAVNRAWTPWLYASLNRGGAALQLRVVRLTYLYFGGLGLLALLISAMAPLIVRYGLGGEFRGSETFVTWVALGFAFNGMYRIVAGHLFYAQRTGVVSIISCVSAATNLLLNFILVPRYGALGAAQATTFTFFLGFVLTWAAVYRIHPMPWNLRSQDR